MTATLVTGATANVGRPLVTELAAAGVEVRAVTRQPDTARFPDGVTAVSTIVALFSASIISLMVWGLVVVLNVH